MKKILLTIGVILSIESHAQPIQDLILPEIHADKVMLPTGNSGTIVRWKIGNPSNAKSCKSNFGPIDQTEGEFNTGPIKYPEADKTYSITCTNINNFDEEDKISVST